MPFATACTLATSSCPVKVKANGKLQDEMMNAYSPVGFREIRRVKNLCWIEWRLRRVRRGETGELAKLLADHDGRAEMLASTHVPQYNQAVANLARLDQIEKQINS